jgi:two-component system, OmpR family, alkaline phosphatase synthesis response regulator PhoP
MPNILLVEDDAEIRLGLEQQLRKEGFALTSFDQGKDAIRYLLQSSAGIVPRLDAALLDLSLPDIDGLDVLRAIRNDPVHKVLPVILVTARSEEIDRVLGLELGADDYLPKPFGLRELVARVRALLRRAAFMEEQAKGQILAYDSISVDLDMHVARVKGEALDLTRREFELLAYFLRNPRRVLSREKILQRVWGLEFLGESRTIDAHVRRLRAKLGDAAAHIETIVGVGYRLGSVDGSGA